MLKLGVPGQRTNMNNLIGPNTFLIIVVLVAILLILIMLFVIRSMRRKRNDETLIQAELIDMERDRQLQLAAEHMQFHQTSSEAMREIESIFRNHLSTSVIAIYHGREWDDDLSKIEPSNSAITQGLQPPQNNNHLPETVPASLKSAFTGPRLTNLRSLMGETLNPEAQNENVLVLPWRAAFQRTGILVARPLGGVTDEDLAKLSEPISRLFNRLAVSLQLEEFGSDADVKSGRSAEFARAVIASINDPAPFDSMAQAIADWIGADSAAIWRIDRANSLLRIAGAYGLPSSEFLPLPLGQGLAGSVLETAETLVVGDVSTDPRCLFPREASENGVVSYMGAPLAIGDEKLGVVEIHSPQENKWTEKQSMLIGFAAPLIAEVVKIIDTSKSHLSSENAYLGLSEALQRLQSSDELMEAVVEVLGHALGVSRAIVVEFAEADQTAAVSKEFCDIKVKSSVETIFPKEFRNNVIARTGGGNVAAINDSRTQSLSGQAMAENLQLLSELVIPIRINEETKGVIYLHQCDKRRDWQQAEIEFAERVGRQLSLSLANLQSLGSASKEATDAREEARRASDLGARAQGLLNALPEAVLAMDQAGKITFFNSAARDWLGLRNEDVGRDVKQTEALNLSDANLWPRILTCDSVTRFETRVIRSTQTGKLAQPSLIYVPVSLAVSPLRNVKGEIAAYLVLISDVRHLGVRSQESGANTAALEQKIKSLEKSLNDAQSNEGRMRELLERAEAASTQAEALRREEAEMKQTYEQLKDDSARLRRSAQQLLEINRLKSEFIVNSGHELESSLHSILGLAELIEKGTYGSLTDEQVKAIRSLHTWARRMKNEVAGLIDYGTARAKRGEQGNE